MEQPDGMDAHMWGVEALTCEIMAKHCVLRQMSDFGLILDEEVAFLDPVRQIMKITYITIHLWT